MVDDTDQAGLKTPTTGSRRAWLIRRNPDFRRFWAGHTISAFGDQITVIAIPTIAVVVLHVSTFVFGLLAAVGYLSYPVFGLIAGAWTDRLFRRWVMMGADAVRLGAVGVVPLAYALGFLNVPVLFAVSLVSGAATCFFSAAYEAYLPSVVSNDDIARGNAMMETSNSASQTAGPSLSGMLIGVLGPAMAMVADAASYAVSVLSIALIRGAEQRPPKPRHSLFPAVREGLVLVWRHSLLRRLAIATAVANLGRGMALELLILFAYKAMYLTPLVVGFALAVGSGATLIGSTVCRRLVASAGLGRVMLAAGFGKGLPWLLIPLTLVLPPIPLVLVVSALSGFFLALWNINTLSLRQYLADAGVRGRVSATIRTIASTAVPLSGVLAGGLATLATWPLGTRGGLAAVLAVGGALWAAATFALPMRSMYGVMNLEGAADTYGRITTPR